MCSRRRGGAPGAFQSLVSAGLAVASVGGRATPPSIRAGAALPSLHEYGRGRRTRRENRGLLRLNRSILTFPWNPPRFCVSRKSARESPRPWFFRRPPGSRSAARPTTEIQTRLPRRLVHQVVGQRLHCARLRVAGAPRKALTSTGRSAMAGLASVTATRLVPTAITHTATPHPKPRKQRKKTETHDPGS